MILAGDVGGTKVALGLFEGDGGPEPVREARFATADYGGLEAVAREFLGDDAGAVERAAFGIAAPILGSEIRMTNLDWEFDRDALARGLGIGEVAFLNDLEAAAYGIDAVDPGRLRFLAEGEPRGPTAGLIAAGTGLGMAILTEAGGRARVLASEGGHTDFAPRDRTGVALFEWLRERHGHVSVERVVSGPGIRTIYEFLRETGREEEPGWLADRLAESDDPPAAISEAALAAEAPICERAMETFVECYGAAAGDLALKALTLRGLYVGGGIAPSILPLLEGDDRFVRAFRAKGRMAGLLAEVPVAVVLEPRTPLLGAARYATLLADGPGSA